MKRVLPILLLLAAVLAGCGGAAGGGGPKLPKAVAPVTEHNFGDVLTTAPMISKEFTIKNEGTVDLKISDIQVKLLEGC